MKRAVLVLLLVLAASAAMAQRRRPALPAQCSAVRGMPAMILSTDGGHTFRDNEEPMPVNAAVYGIAALDASTVLVTTPDALYESHDGGCSYRATASLKWIRYAAIVGASSVRAYLWTHDAIARWDHGSLTPLVPPRVGWIQSLGAAGDDAGIVDDKGNVWLSHDAGGTWTQHGSSSQRVFVYNAAFDPHDFRHIVRSGAGIEVSRDGGETWTKSLTPSNIVYEVAMSPVDPAIVWVAALEGLLVSTDGGATFRIAAAVQIPTNLVPAPRDAARVYWRGFDVLHAFDLRGGVHIPLVQIPWLERFEVAPNDAVIAARTIPVNY